MKHIFLSFLTPPGLAVLAGLALLWWFRPKRKALLICLTVGFFTLWLPSTMVFARFVSLSLLNAVESRPATNAENSDMIVVLTRGMYQAENVGWLPTASTYRRMAIAYELQRITGSRTPILVSGGKTVGVNHPSEAFVTANFFDRFQAQYTPIVLEETSTNTYESSLQVAAILQKREVDNVFLITDEVHMLRALASYRARGIDPIPFPAITLPLRDHRLTYFLPSAEAARFTAHALYEVYGLISYLLTGKVKWSDIFYKPTTES